MSPSPTSFPFRPLFRTHSLTDPMNQNTSLHSSAPLLASEFLRASAVPEDRLDSLSPLINALAGPGDASAQGYDRAWRDARGHLWQAQEQRQISRALLALALVERASQNREGPAADAPAIKQLLLKARLDEDGPRPDYAALAATHARPEWAQLTEDYGDAPKNRPPLARAKMST